MSAQNLIDCSEENSGCHGGSVEQALKFVRKAGGLNDEMSYPYNGAGMKPCSPVKNYTMHNKGPMVLDSDEQMLKRFIAFYGPVAVYMEVDIESVRHYASGIISDRGCNHNHNHAMLAVGYGTNSDGHRYWIVVSIKTSFDPNVIQSLSTNRSDSISEKLLGQRMGLRWLWFRGNG